MSQRFHMGRREAAIVLLGLLGTAARVREVFAFDVVIGTFRDEVLALARRHYAGTVPALRPGSGQNDLIWGGHHLYLDNLYAAVGGLPSTQRETAILAWLKRFDPEAQAVMEATRKITDEWGKAGPLLRPRLQRIALTAYKQLVWQPFSSTLVIAYALDLGDKDLYVRKEKLAAWSVRLDEVHATAIANLERMSAPLSLERPKPPDNAVGSLLTIQTGDGYDASRLLLPAFRTRLLDAMGPSLRAGVPDRDSLYVWTADFTRRRDVEDEVRERAIRGAHALSGEIFVFDAKGVRVAGDN